MVAKYDPCAALMINRGNRILIVLHLFCCSNPKLSYNTSQRMLRALLVLSCYHFDSKHLIFLCILSLFIINDWIIIMGYSKHELSVVNMLHSLKNIIILHPYLAIMATALHNCHFLLSVRWPLWRGLTVFI